MFLHVALSRSSRPPAHPKVCCVDFDLYGPGAFDDQCAKIFAEAKGYCSKKGLQLHMTQLTRTLLGFSKSSEYPVATLQWNLVLSILGPIFFSIYQ